MGTSILSKTVNQLAIATALVFLASAASAWTTTGQTSAKYHDGFVAFSGQQTFTLTPEAKSKDGRYLGTQVTIVRKRSGKLSTIYNSLGNVSGNTLRITLTTQTGDEYDFIAYRGDAVSVQLTGNNAR